jgi:hypothetical protein
VEYHETFTNLICPYSVRCAGRAHGLCEAKSQVADECTNNGDYAEQTHLFAPCSLLRFLGLTEAAKNSVRTPESDGSAVDIPQTWWFD